jgi:hypothetical protein
MLTAGIILSSAAGALACTGDVILDDYRQSRAIVRGIISNADGIPIEAAVVELAPIRPPYLLGDTVTTDPRGAFSVELATFGVGSFEAEVQLRVRGPGGVSRDTTLTGVRVLEDRPWGRQPDTVTVVMKLPSR